VIDTGVGIPVDEQAAILEPFVVGTTAGDQRGAGLGLSIVLRLVSAMGGGVTLESSVGAGSRFDVRLRLPVATPPPDDDGDDLPEGLTVLVVEDNPVNQQLARSQLERLGLFPIVVTTGEECLALLGDADAPPVDVIFMDHQLPGMSGVEATQRLRALGGAVAELPVIGLSAAASSSRSDRDAFVDAGMDDFVAKPASLDDLSNAIARALRRPRSTTADDGAPRGAPIDAPVPPVVDHAVLESLADELGGSSIVVELISTFLDELDPRIEAILAGSTDDVAGARRAAHTLKSSARLLGAHLLADVCLAVERDGERLHDVRPLAERTRIALRAWQAEQKRPG
jgi:CheY-like chemotaxis protein/HPt (histidine-containing phosphotransfer) domain-containing protein